jgi:hypothetical protein
MKNVKYLLMFVTISACLFASAQRVGALGGNVGYWADDDNSYTAFPYSINSSNLAQVSGINTAGHAAIVRWGEGTKWGFTWDQASSNDMVNIQYGNGDYGATFGLGMWANDDGIDEDDGGDNAGAQSSMGLSGSYGRVMDFGEIGVGFSNYSKNDGMTATTNDISRMNLWVNLRRAHSLWIFDNMLVNFGYDTDNAAAAAATAGADDAQTTMTLGVNYYTHIGIGDNTTALVAMGFGYASTSNKMNAKDAKDTKMTLPNWTVGIESAMTDWATVRVGLTAGYNLSDVTNAGGTGVKDVSKRGGTSTNVTFGLAFNYGNFSLDMTVDEDLFVNPVSHVTGFSEVNNTNSTTGVVGGQATLTYAW